MEEEIEATSNEPMVSWEDHVGVKEDLVTVPKCGGLFNQDDNKVPANASGPEVLLTIISCVGTYPYDTVEKLKSKLKKIKLSNYPGDNVQRMNVDIKAQCDILDDAGYWEKDLLHVITKKYKSFKCAFFCLWTISTISEETTAYLKMSTLQGDTNIPGETKVTYGSIVKDTTAKHEEL
eukprot:12024692-Ditylum_brightwellii.AAC.1